MKQQQKAYIFAILAILMWSTVASVFKIALSVFSPELMLFYASISTSFVLLFIYYFDKSAPKVSFSDFRKSLIPSLFNPFIYYLILFKAYHLLPAQIAQPLNYTWPIVLTIFSSYIFKEKLKITVWIGLFISFIGVIIISWQSRSIGDISGIGLFLALSSSIVWSIYWIINLKDQRVNSLKLLTNFFIGSLYILIYLWFRDVPFAFDTKGVLASIYIGFFEMGITFFVWLKALSLASNKAKINNLVFLSPFISFFFIAMILKENIQIMSILGLIIIISGILLQQIVKR